MTTPFPSLAGACDAGTDALIRLINGLGDRWYLLCSCVERGEALLSEVAATEVNAGRRGLGDPNEKSGTSLVRSSTGLS